MLLDFEKAIMKFHGCLLVVPPFLDLPHRGTIFLNISPHFHIFFFFFLSVLSFFSLFFLYSVLSHFILMMCFYSFLFLMSFHIYINFKILRCCELCEHYVIPVKTSKISILFIFYFFRCFFRSFCVGVPVLISS